LLDVRLHQRGIALESLAQRKERKRYDASALGSEK